MDREFTLKTLLVMFLRKTKQIVVWALILGVLLGGFMAFSAYRDGSVSEEQGDVEKFDKQLNAAREAVERLERQIADGEEYLEQSLYQALNPFNKGEGSVLFYVDPEADELPATPGADPRETLIAAYLSFYSNDEELLREIRELLGTELDDRYVLELIDVSIVSGTPDSEMVQITNSNIVQIAVSYEDASVAKQIARLVCDASQQRINETVREHTTTIVAERSGYVVDTALRESQLEYEQTLTELKTALTEKQTALTELESSVASDGTGVSLFSIAKKGVIGFVIGVIVAAVAVFVFALLGGKLQSVDELAGLDIPLVGIVPKAGRKCFVARWIRKLEGDPAIEPEQALSLIGANLDNLAAGQKVGLVGTADAALLSELAASLKDRAVLCGDVLQEPNAVKALDEADGVVLVEERGASSANKMQEELARLKALSKSVIGIIVR